MKVLSIIDNAGHARFRTPGEKFFARQGDLTQEYLLHCKENQRSMAGKEPPFGRVANFQTRPSKIAQYSRYPQRCVCAHPYNPPHLIPLVELVGIPGSEKTLETLKAFYTSLGKEPIILKKEVPGFIGNRLQTAVGREIIDLVMKGVCTVEDTDKALTFGPGLRWAIMGQNLLYQLGGGSGGVRGLYQKIGGDPNRKTWLDDMARWTKYPPEWPDIAQAGVDKAIKARPAEIGNTGRCRLQEGGTQLF